MNTERWIIKEKAILQETRNVKEVKPGKVRYEVTLQIVDEPGYNGKAYLKECMATGINKIGDTIRKGGLVSELDHPCSTNESRLINIEWKSVCQRICSIAINGNRVEAVCENTSNSHGQDLYALIKHDKLPIGFSLRAIGDVRNTNKGYQEVFRNLDIVTWDVVARPSFAGAVIKRIINSDRFEHAKLQENIKNFEELVYGERRESLMESKKYRNMCELIEKIDKDYYIDDPDLLMKYIHKIYKYELTKKYTFLS